MKKSRVCVSDHAVLRYLERVQGMDIERLRREIGARVDHAAALGACGIIISGFSYRIENNTVTTILRAHRCDSRIGPKRRGRVQE
ncbi:hypothetical protein [Roseinatronobacter sp. NSM]|uniref:hypothetical protein n=1 Tax=Roseinatronobacter sp. NSM TaxID=3457785 RepID=UPI004034F7D1